MTVNAVDLSGTVVAIVASGGEVDRAIAVALAEAGASIAFATFGRVQAQEFAMASIANEVWAIGREQFLAVIDATDPADVAAFADQVWDQFQRCDAVITHGGRAPAAPFEEFSLSEFEAELHTSLSPAFLVTQAFGRLMARSHGGRMVHCFREPGEGEPLDAGYLAARSAAHGLVAALRGAWGHDGVDGEVVTLPAEQSGAADRALAVERVLACLAAG
jgi:NAD(P)-dependent dehydrogenase (short-subunit alcohol dehydrogenase family)